MSLVTLKSLDSAISETIDYTRERKVFGRSILDNQAVHFRLAELGTEVEALRALTYRAVGEGLNDVVDAFYDLAKMEDIYCTLLC